VKTTRITAPDGSVTTVKTKSGCGCLTAVLVLFVVAGPAYYADHGQWPLGWTGAFIAYALLGVVAVLGAVRTA
jgi:hypothetical protein